MSGTSFGQEHRIKISEESCRELIDTHFEYLRKKIIEEAERKSKMLGHSEILCTHVAQALDEYSPGKPFPVIQTGVWRRFITSVSPITIISAILGLLFLVGYIIVTSNDKAFPGLDPNGLFDIIQIFAGAVVGSTGASGLAAVRGQ